MAKTSILMKMGLDSSKVKAGLQKAGASVKEFSANASSRLDGLKDRFGGIAKVISGALLTGLTAAAKSSLSYAKEMANLSNIANTGVEDFQRLAYGAKTVGIDAAKMADIFKDTADKIGDFMSNDAGPTADFFRNLAGQVGVTADSFKNLSGKDALQLYYSVLERANLSQEQMTFYMEAIASDASALNPLLAEQGKLWKELANQADNAGVVMEEGMIQELKEAQLEIDKLSARFTIFGGASIMGFKMAGTAIGLVVDELDKLVMGFEHVFRGTFSFDSSQLNNGLDAIVDVVMGGGKRIKKGMDAWWDVIVPPQVTTEIIEFEQMGVDAFKGFYKEGSKGAKEVTEADRKRTEAAIKGIEEQRKFESELGKVRAKIVDEQLKRAALLQTAEQNHNDAKKKRQKMEEQYAKLSSITNEAVIEAMGLEALLLDAKLRVEKSITAESQTQIKLLAEQKKQQEDRVKQARQNVQLQIEEAIAAGDVFTARRLEEQIKLEDQIQSIIDKTGAGREKALEIAKKQNARTAERKELELDLAIAMTKGNASEIAALDHKLDRQQRIDALMDAGLNDREEAAALVDAENARLKEQETLRLDLIRAQANGNDELATALEKQIKAEEERNALMEEFKISAVEATAIVNKLAAIKAGPDLNRDGMVTRFEQKAFDREQKAKAKIADKKFKEAERQDRERGGNIPNVSGKRRNTGTVAERMEQAMEESRKRRENQAINRERDPAKKAALIKKADDRIAKRKADIAAKNQPGVIPNGKVNGKDGLDVKKPEPKDPAKAANDLLGKQLTELQAIKKALSC